MKHIKNNNYRGDFLSTDTYTVNTICGYQRLENAESFYDYGMPTLKPLRHMLTVKKN